MPSVWNRRRRVMPCSVRLKNVVVALLAAAAVEPAEVAGSDVDGESGEQGVVRVEEDEKPKDHERCREGERHEDLGHLTRLNVYDLI